MGARNESQEKREEAPRSSILAKKGPRRPFNSCVFIKAEKRRSLKTLRSVAEKKERKKKKDSSGRTGTNLMFGARGKKKKKKETLRALSY